MYQIYIAFCFPGNCENTTAMLEVKPPFQAKIPHRHFSKVISGLFKFYYRTIVDKVTVSITRSVFLNRRMLTFYTVTIIVDVVIHDDCKCKLYADDIKIYSILDDVCDGADIQVKLDELQNWSDQWQLDISYKKCNALLLTNKKEIPSLALTLCDKQLPIVDSVKDLGVIMDNQLKFDVHVNNIVLRAHKIANLIHKCFVSKDPPTLIKAFLVYVRPVLEYASCVWSSQSVGLIKTASFHKAFSML